MGRSECLLRECAITGIGESTINYLGSGPTTLEIIIDIHRAKEFEEERGRHW